MIYKTALVLFVTTLWFACNSKETFMEGSSKSVLLEFPGVKTNLIVKARVWGVAGGHEITTVQEDNGKPSDSSQIQIFYTSEIYYHKGVDKLVVYARKSSITTLLDSIGRVRMEVITIDNRDKLNELARTYKSKGLDKLSAYEN